MRSTVAFFLCLVLAGCSGALPAESRKQVRKENPEVSPGVTVVQPANTADRRAEALQDLIAVGMTADLLLERCGPPESRSAEGDVWLYRSCGVQGRFEAEVLNGRVVRLRY